MAADVLTMGQEGNGNAPTEEELAAVASRLGPGQRRVVERLLADYRDAAVVSPRELAAELDVSPSTVTRAAQALGFAGFPDFQAYLRDRFYRVSRERLTANVHRGEESPAVGAIRIMYKEAEDVRATAEDLDPAALQAAVEMLVSARRVYVFGTRGSLGLAIILSIRLRILVDDVRLLSLTAGDLPEQLLPLTRQDVVVVVDYSLIDRVALRVAEHAVSVDAPVIAITNHVPNPISRIAALTFVARSEDIPRLPSYTAGSAIVDALSMAIWLQNGAIAERRRSTANRILDDFETFAGW